MKKNALIKCVVWDLDNTLWDGVLLEGGARQLREGARAAVSRLDERGILQSISSRNEPEAARAKLVEFGLEAYFLYPEIHWEAKSEALRRIASNLNIGLNSIVFIDDQEYEREEVRFALPEARCIDPSELPALLASPLVADLPVTAESRQRRLLYQAEGQRKDAEQRFAGNTAAFHESLGLEFTLFRPRGSDLARASELTARTNQLNTTGIVYSQSELEALLASERHEVLLAKLSDRFGDYGTVGLAVAERQSGVLRLHLLLMSCRVMSRGVGTVFLIHLLNLAKQEGRRFVARFKKTDRNRMMYITYKMNGFKVAGREGDEELLEHPLEDIQQIPDYLRLTVPERRLRPGKPPSIPTDAQALLR